MVTEPKLPLELTAEIVEMALRPDPVGDFISVLQILFIIAIPAIMIILIVWIKNKERMKRYELQADLYAKALEKGEKIPDNLFEPAYLKYSKQEQMSEQEELAKLKQNALNVGIILMAAGIGAALVTWFVGFFIGQIDGIKEQVSAIIKAASAVGIIPFLIGVAFMIIHFLEKKKDS